MKKGPTWSVWSYTYSVKVHKIFSQMRSHQVLYMKNLLRYNLKLKVKKTLPEKNTV